MLEFRTPLSSFFYLFLAAVLLGRSWASCPHDNLDLKKWSSPSSWPNNQVPQEDDIVTISNSILLDMSPPDLFGIEIKAGGKLVWSPDVEINLVLRHIVIRGEMHIGSETCKFTGKTKITLKGRRGEYMFMDDHGMEMGHAPHFTEKMIGVAEGGTLELHGREVVSWTKLTKTLPKIDDTPGVLFNHKAGPLFKHNNWMRGVVLYILDPSEVDPPVHRVLHFDKNWVYRANQDKQQLIDLLNDAKPGSLIMVASQNLLTTTVDLSSLADVFESVAFGSVNHNSPFRSSEEQSFAAIIIKGIPSLTRLDVASTKTNSILHATATYLDDKHKIVVESLYNVDRTWESYNDFRITLTEYSRPIIDVVDVVSSWKEGDKIVIASTDFDMEEVETGKVVKCDTCSNQQVRIDIEPKFEHFGQIVDNTDMRAEVGLLTRNIVIESIVQDFCPPENENCKDLNFDSFGGHIKFMKGFANVHVEYVELYHMGASTDLGRYPLHFHMCEDVDTMPNPPYLRGNAIHHTLARCITIHGTHGVQVLDNVCYEHTGHGYFLEDGGEKRTVLDGNLGLMSRKGSILPTDKTHPSTFWITNPQVYFRNNVAAGSERIGIWFLFPEEPIGSSAGKGFMAKGEARLTPVYEFDNNVAHSCLNTGMFLDNILQPDGSASGTNRYNPKVDRFDPKSADKMTVFNRLTAYKNRAHNLWARGGEIKFEKASLSDSSITAILARSGPGNQYISNSVVVGESINKGKAGFMYDSATNKMVPIPRDVGRFWLTDFPLIGVVFYDGPVYLENIWFGGFKEDRNYKAAAISFRLTNLFASSPVSGVTGMQFGFEDSDSSRFVYEGNSSTPHFSDFNGDLGATFRDIDGSVTGITGSTIIRDIPFQVTPACYYKDSWNVAVCPHRYGKVRVFYDQDKYPVKTFMIRDDIPNDRLKMGKGETEDFLTILGGRYSYTLHFDGEIPDEYSLYATGFEKDLFVRVGICMPKGATYNLFTYVPRWAPTIDTWTRYNSLAELDADTAGAAYCYDGDAEILFIRIMSLKERPSQKSPECGGHCPVVKITVSGDRSNGDCSAKAYPKYTTSVTENNRITSLSVPSAVPTPPNDRGAGATRPFQSRMVVDGGFSQWTQWSACDVTCGGGNQVRTRECNNPIPVNGGKDCEGSAKESRPCNDNTCPIDGGWGTWTSWSQCTSVDVNFCNGFQKKTRACGNPSPSNGGQYCLTGSAESHQPCKTC